VTYRPNTKASNIIDTQIYIQSIYSKMRLVEETKGGGKELKKDSK
jgi:hypothetical protein